ncbi:MAG: type 1 glutamine amidotransferase domain-containing protein [Vulcanimicrobiaceae bacterium]
MVDAMLYDEHHMNIDLTGVRVAALIAEGFEQVEFTSPRDALVGAGATVRIVSPEKGEVCGFNHHDRADRFPVDVALEAAKATDFDALLLPGGALNPDALRMLPAAVAFVRAFVDARKPVAAICHAPWTLVEADAVRGRTLTSWPSIATDLRNAGATWVDRDVVVDGLLVTSRKPDDLPAFEAKMLEVFASAKAGVT